MICLKCDLFVCLLISFSSLTVPLHPPPSFILSFFQVMETKNMLYLVTEYAKNGEIFGEFSFFSVRWVVF